MAGGDLAQHPLIAPPAQFEFGGHLEGEFDLAAFNADVDGTNAKLMEALHGA